MRLDVITIVSASTPASYLNECRRSVRMAADHAGFPVTLIESPGVPGSVGAAMVRSLGTSASPYVAWVDDDDFVWPNAFACLRKHFDRQPSAICAREISWLANGRLVPCHHRHHLTAFHRDIIEGVPLIDHPAFTLPPLLAKAGERVVDELSWVYVHRIRMSEAHKVRRQHGASR
jgi:hypothetical protein